MFYLLNIFSKDEFKLGMPGTIFWNYGEWCILIVRSIIPLFLLCRKSLDFNFVVMFIIYRYICVRVCVCVCVRVRVRVSVYACVCVESIDCGEFDNMIEYVGK